MTPLITPPPPGTAIDDRNTLRRVVLRNFRSIKECDVPIGRLTFLVGPNGSGKSNFLDALRFTTDALRGSLDHALRDRGGLDEVRRRSSGHPTDLSIELDLRVEAQEASFAFVIGATSRGYVVKREAAKLGTAQYQVRAGKVDEIAGEVMPPASDDRLYLVNAAGLPRFRPLYDALCAMGFYNLNPDAIRKLQAPDQGDLLARDGANLASVLDRLERARPHPELDRIREYLSRIVEGVTDVHAKRVGHMETIEFTQAAQGESRPFVFPAINMSDGTLRALGILVALFQGAPAGRVRFIGVEEPEAALHPAAASVLRDALREGADHTQVMVTSHSPDLLDSSDIDADSLLAVTLDGGDTRIGEIDDASREALRTRMYSPGELLRMAQLQPRPAKVRPPSTASQLPLFTALGDAE